MIYSQFLPSTILAPLNALLKSDVPWRWSQEERKAFDASKKLLCESKTLGYIMMQISHCVPVM